MTGYHYQQTVFLRRVSGFTLIELITVIIVLAITSTIGAGFVVDVVDQYQKAQVRSTLVRRGSVVMEQLSRQLRMAVPNSVRISPTSDCVEYMPLLGGSFYTDAVSDAENGMAAVSAVSTVSFSLNGETPEHVLIAPMSASEIYTLSTTASRVTAGSWGSEPYSTVIFSSAHQFHRNSLNRRLLVAGDPKRFCISGQQLVRYEGYGLNTAAISNAIPSGASTVLMATEVDAVGTAFALSVGSENRNAALTIALAFSDQTESIILDSQVFIRNVP